MFNDFTMVVLSRLFDIALRSRKDTWHLSKAGKHGSGHHHTMMML
jgi:hypothetical protein